MIVPLEWDSRHFGFAVARLAEVPADDETLAGALAASDARVIYALVDAADAAALALAQRHGFRAVDVRVELERGLPDPEAAPLEELTDPAEVAWLAGSAFELTRFRADPGFPRDRADALYVAWVERAATEPDRFLLADARRGGFIAGSGGTIELVAVAPQARGQGLGVRLVRGAHARLEGSAARVVTQGANVAAQRLYQACGYRTSACGIWLHRWS